MQDSSPEQRPGRVGVLLPLPLAGAYDYAVPPELAITLGDYVEVPLGPRLVTGVVWSAGSGEVAASRLKPVARRFPLPAMPEVGRRFIDWVAAYTLSLPGQALRMALSAQDALEPLKPVVGYRRAETPAAEVRETPARRRVLTLLADGPPRVLAELAHEAGCGAAVIRGLVDAGALETVLLPAEAPVARPDWQCPGPALSPAQAEAAETLREKLAAGGYSATLLDGVTGAGKTEVYFEAIAAALAAGRQVLVLLPEIALSSQWLDRFAARFGVRPAEWHSDLTQTRRRRTWRAVATGEATVVVGARSALFLPYAALGLIVVDEEHESAFKQEDGVTYHARDMAVARAFLGGFPIVLVSATPSLETLVNVESGRYGRIDLPARHGGAALPEISLIDLREDRPERRRWLSPTLTAALVETLAAGEQAMLFLNRRGYAPLTLCRGCGHRLHCPNCSAWLVEHRLAGRLQCHHCGHATALPETCPGCGKAGLMAGCGPGVERIAEEAVARFPEARIAIMASDTLIGPLAMAELVRKVAAHELDLLIGTQVMAKGHHFPMLTLVGVVDADLGLAGGDLRAAERTYQLLHQVAGRAGRAERPGRVFLQSYMPEHPVMQALASGDRDRFLAQEAEERRALALPPFGRLVALVVSGADPEAVDKVAQALGRAAPRSADIDVLGPAPAPLALLRGRHRRRLLLRAPRSCAVQPIVRTWLAAVTVPNSVRVQIDVDPYSFL
ncbi:MAG: primosomal protein N' [Azospirillum sp.]|nr:primosomal protein N' [Azospirillum sp.]